MTLLTIDLDQSQFSGINCDQLTNLYERMTILRPELLPTLTPLMHSVDVTKENQDDQDRENRKQPIKAIFERNDYEKGVIEVIGTHRARTSDSVGGQHVRVYSAAERSWGSEP